MKFFSKYIFPAFYGLLVYFTIRLLHDVEVDELFWQRDWALNAFEMSCSVLVGYGSIYLFGRLFLFYDSQWSLQLNYQGVVRELVIFVLANLVLVNLIFTPMAAFTDDGLSWADFADLNVIPTLYAIIYYGIARSSTWLKAYTNNKIQLEKVINDHLETELKFLKAQYHPHFMFNALNTIYFQMDDDIKGAKKSIETFSELLRYQLYDQQKQVPIIHEIDYLKSFIELQKIRSTDRLVLKVFFDQPLINQLVYPLLFLPLVENAFKFIGGEYQMLVSARVDDDWITFIVENSVPSILRGENNTSGIGLENLKRRLDLLYPGGKHQFKLEREKDQFNAVLKLKYER